MDNKPKLYLVPPPEPIPANVIRFGRLWMRHAWDGEGERKAPVTVLRAVPPPKPATPA